MRAYVRDALNPFLLKYFKVGIAPHTRWLSGQRSHLLGVCGVDTIVDVGANCGQYGIALRREGFRGTIHSLEPGAKAYAELSKRAGADQLWHVHHLGLGARSGSAHMHSWDGPSSAVSSLRNPVARMRQMHGEPNQEEVRILTLPDWLNESGGVRPGESLLKIDVQGSEREVLLGSGDALALFPVIEIEAAVAELYDGEAALPELLLQLTEAGFVVASIMTERFHTGWHGAADVDVLMIRRELSALPR